MLVLPVGMQTNRQASRAQAVSPSHRAHALLHGLIDLAVTVDVRLPARLAAARAEVGLIGQPAPHGCVLGYVLAEALERRMRLNVRLPAQPPTAPREESDIQTSSKTACALHFCWPVRPLIIALSRLIKCYAVGDSGGRWFNAGVMLPTSPEVGGELLQ